VNDDPAAFLKDYTTWFKKKKLTVLVSLPALKFGNIILRAEMTVTSGSDDNNYFNPYSDNVENMVSS